jgi:hypothetical protein
MPSLPSTLRTLYFDNNSITTVPVLPSGLEIFGCEDNPLGTLPALPPSLTNFYCSNTGISILPSLPASLLHLACSRNFLTSLPALPGGLITLRCDSNQLTSFPDLPDSIAYLTLKYNYQLTCLPRLTKISTLDFQFCPVTCLPNYGNVNASYPQLSSLPLCDVFNASGCNFYWNISGKTFFDPDSNCMQVVTEPGLKNMHLELYQNNVLVQQAFTGGEGFYSFDVNTTGNYEVRLDTAFLPFTAVCPLSNNYLDTISAQDSVVYNNDFASRCKFGFDVGVWSIVPSILRPSYLTPVRIRAGDIANFYGVHCASGISGALTITINGNAHYFGPVAGALSPSIVSGNTITFNIADFDSINSLSDFAFVIETDTNAVSGSQICFDVNVTPLAGDNNASNNTLTNCFSVMASFDPNDKQVYPNGITDTSQHWLTYTIRFQNTGTASADNIYILDTLDSNFDLSTFQLLSTSHQSYTQILDGGIARFNFPNINLPDSNANEPLSHGYVQYKIKLKENLPIGTQIQNTAYIYFDFNAPVVTNTTSNTIDVTSKISTPGKAPVINTWPVPFDNYITIEGDHSIKGSHYSIVNLLGKEMVRGKMNEQQLKISTLDWASGIYFLRVETGSGVVGKKIVKN